MRAIRFRCPKCLVHHTASASRAGRPLACSSCFSPMIVPETAGDPSAEAPIARSIEVAPPEDVPSTPEPAVVEAGPTPEDAPRPAPRPRRKAVAARPPAPAPAPIILPDLPATNPEPEPGPVELPPGVAAVGPGMVPFHRVALASTAILAAIALAIGVHAIVRPRRAREAAAIAPPLPVAVAEAVPDRPGPIRAPEPAGPPAPSPEPVAATAPAPAPEPGGPVVTPDPVPDPEAEKPAPVAAPAPAPVPAPARPAADRPLVIRRRQRLDQEALRRQLSGLPELKISHHTEAKLLSAHGLAPIPHAPQRRSPRAAGFGNPAGFLAPAFDGPAARRARPNPLAFPDEGQAEDEDGPGMRVAHPRDHARETVALLARSQPELGHLPWRMGEECHLPHEAAEELEVQSRSIRDRLQVATPADDGRPDPEALRASLLGGARLPFAALGKVRSDRPAAVPALMQLLMAERTPVRLVLVDVLARIEGPAASKALARLAIFDLAPEVREAALIALRSRPMAESRPTLLGGLRYPWAPVADHAAEALVALEDREAIPALVELLDAPDPARPRTEVRSGRPVTYVRTLAQVGHLRNCLLCHAPSTNATTDLVRGRVPTEGAPLPPPREYYASTSPGAFVRAEVTYLQQDFSAIQPVEHSGPWPAYQRYDYLVFELPASDHPARHPKGKDRDKDADRPAGFPQRESTLFALRELTGQDLGDDSAAWKDVGRR